VGRPGIGADEGEDPLNPTGSNLPTVREAVFVLFITFLLTIGTQLLGFFLQGKGILILAEMMLILPALVFVLYKRFPMVSVFRWHVKDLRLIVAGGMIGIGLSPISDALDRLVQKVIPMPPEIMNALESFMRFQSPGEMVLLFLTLVVAAPVVEEMLFRGLLQGAFERSVDVNKAVFSTALIFTFIHFNPWWAAEILIAGILLGVLAWRSNSIVPGIAMHAVTNGLSLGVINTGSRKLNWYEFKGYVAPQWIVLGAALVYLGFKWVYKLTQKESSHGSHS